MTSKTGVLVIVLVVLLTGFTGGVTLASLTDTETVGVSVGVDEAPATESPATPSVDGQNTTLTATPNGTTTPNGTATPNETTTATPTTTDTPNETTTATPTTDTPNETALGSPTATKNTPDTETNTAE